MTQAQVPVLETNRNDGSAIRAEAGREKIKDHNQRGFVQRMGDGAGEERTELQRPHDSRIWPAARFGDFDGFPRPVVRCFNRPEVADKSRVERWMAGRDPNTNLLPG